MIKATGYLRDKDILTPLVIALCWLIALLITLPYGNFPLNDDWAYAKIVRHLLDHHRFFINDWPAMTLFSHILWGTLFCKIFGFSFMILRVSVAVTGFIGIFAAYYLFGMLSKNRFLVITALLIMVFNPYFFSLSLTFMTDVSFTTVTLLATLFFMKFLSTEKKTWFFAAILFCVISVLIRQIGLLLPVAFAFVLLVKSRFSIKNFIPSVLPVLVTMATLDLFIIWLQKNQTLPPDFGKSTVIIQNLFHNTAFFLWDRVGLIAFYIVAIAFPVSLVGFRETWKSSSRKLKIAVFSAIALLLVFIQNKFYSIPVENIVYNFGIGPRLLKDSYWGLTPMSKIPKDLVNVINLVILLFILPFLLNLFRRLWEMFPSLTKGKINSDEQRYLTVASFVALYSLFLVFNNSIFDRYFLPVYPFIIALVLPRENIEINGKMKVLIFAFIGGMTLFSIAGTHDYFSWSRARWKATAYLLNDKKVQPAMIDGGFEFNGWYSTARIKRSLVSRYSKSWWFVDDDQYMVASGKLNCYSIIKSFPYFSLLPFGGDSVFVLSRNPLIGKTSISCDAEHPANGYNQICSSDALHYFSYSGNLSGVKKHSGLKSFFLEGSKKSWVKIKSGDFAPYEKVKVCVWKYPANSDAGIKISSNYSDNFNFFVKNNIVSMDSTGWVKIEAEINIPWDFGKNEIEFCVYNPGRTACWADDFEILNLKYLK